MLRTGGNSFKPEVSLDGKVDEIKERYILEDEVNLRVQRYPMRTLHDKGVFISMRGRLPTVGWSQASAPTVTDRVKRLPEKSIHPMTCDGVSGMSGSYGLGPSSNRRRDMARCAR